ncbi:ribose-5-phosphate isomerase rki1 [Mycoemilia scoparia]|uniref:Ribose-5-phosphate isomerase n=1 Tax=Mycoemilia scoparia TaxID=417184 RepID=A0A9W7ZW24_9FUNG|nr:ribose-5-phosphate isomerase rki1 [Mycoemilia scoparia]
MSSKNLVETAKELAAFSAVEKHVTKDIRVLGVGSGSTVVYAINKLKELLEKGQLSPDLVCIPTSFQSRGLIVDAGLRLGDLDENPDIDITIDGADEVDSKLNAIKGGGAAHLREKVVASASKRLILIADYRKDSAVLGEQWTKGVPVEVTPFAYKAVERKITELHHKNSFQGASASSAAFEFTNPVVILRPAVNKAGPVVTDNGNFVFDVKLGKIHDPASVETVLKMIPGVVEVGIFSNMAEEAWFGKEDGTAYCRSL